MHLKYPEIAARWDKEYGGKIKKKTKKKTNPAQELVDKVRNEKIRPDMNAYLGPVKVGTKVSNPQYSLAQNSREGTDLYNRISPILPNSWASKIAHSKLGEKLSPANIQLSPSLLDPKLKPTSPMLFDPNNPPKVQTPLGEKIALSELAGQFFGKNIRVDPELDLKFMKAWNKYADKVGRNSVNPFIQGNKEIRGTDAFSKNKGFNSWGFPAELYEKVAMVAGSHDNIPTELKPFYYWMKDSKKQKTTTMKKKISLSGIKTGIRNTGKGILGAYKTAFKNWVDDSMERNFPKKKNTKAKLVVNNKMKAFGQMDPKTNVVEVNLKKHKGDKIELANTIHHELLHVKHPDMSERDVKNKADRETDMMSPAEKQMLVAKVRNKKMHYKQGAMKRKFKMGRSETKPGDFISKMNQSKLTRKDVAIRGLI